MPQRRIVRRRVNDPRSRCAILAACKLLYMSLSASEFYEAGLTLPPSVRKDVALRLLESLEVSDDEPTDESWSAEIEARVDAVLQGKVEMVPGDQVFADIAARRAIRRG